MKSHLVPLQLYELKNFSAQSIVVNSQILKNNPLNDPVKRYNPVLVPRGQPPKNGYPVILELSGFTGNGPKSFAPKSFEKCQPQQIDEQFEKKLFPKAIIVFVDAMTFWGGSQFLNSSGTGLYEDYIVKELTKSICNQLPVNKDPKYWCVMGLSSGGYGALHLASRYPKIFGNLAAISPDCFFEASIVPEVRHALPRIQQLGGVKSIEKMHRQGKLMGRKDSHTLLNVIGMGTCYAPGSSKNTIEFPIGNDGLLDKVIWKKWLQNDPISFLPKRKASLRKLTGVFLDTGVFDQFQLQYGTRQIHNLLKQIKIPHQYSEFDGNHFDCSSRRPEVWNWLKKKWRGQ